MSKRVWHVALRRLLRRGRAHSQRGDRVVVRRKTLMALTGKHVPRLDEAVLATTNHVALARRVGAQRKAQHPGSVFLVLLKLSHCPHVFVHRCSSTPPLKRLVRAVPP